MAKRKTTATTKQPTQDDRIKAYCEANNIAYEVLTEDQRQEVVAMMGEDEPVDEEESNRPPTHQTAATAAPVPTAGQPGPVFALYHFYSDGSKAPTMVYIGSDKAAAFDKLVEFGKKTSYSASELRIDYAS